MWVLTLGWYSTEVGAAAAAFVVLFAAAVVHVAVAGQLQWVCSAAPCYVVDQVGQQKWSHWDWYWQGIPKMGGGELDVEPNHLTEAVAGTQDTAGWLAHQGVDHGGGLLHVH